MPGNHGHTATLATWTFHSKIRTILRILTILTIVQSTLELSSDNKDNDKDYLVKPSETYGSPTSLSIFPKGIDNETREEHTSTEDQKDEFRFDESKYKRYSSQWKDKEEKKRLQEKDRWQKDVNKAVLTSLLSNTIKREIDKKYQGSRSFLQDSWTISRTKEVKEKEDGTTDKRKERREEENGGNNEESSRSKEDRNSNNFMTETPWNRETEENDRTGGSEKGSVRTRGRGSSKILRGDWIKRSEGTNAKRGCLFRKDETSFNTGKSEDDRINEGEEIKIKGKERKRERREINSLFAFDERGPSKRSIFEERKVRIESLVRTREDTKKEEEGWKKEKENEKFMTTISFNDDSPKDTSETEDRKREGNEGRWKEEMENGTKSVEGNFRKVEEKEKPNERRTKVDEASRGVVDNFSSKDKSFSYLSTGVRKSTQRDTVNREGFPTESLHPWYRDNGPSNGKGFRSLEPKREEDWTTTTTTERGNLVGDKVKEKGGLEKSGSRWNADSKSEKKNVLVTVETMKEFPRSLVHASTLPGSIKYTKEGGYRVENRITGNEVASSNGGNESFSSVTRSSVVVKNVKGKNETAKESRNEGNGDRTNLASDGGSMYSSIAPARTIKDAEYSTTISSRYDKNGGKGGVPGSVGNISENTVLFWNSTYPNHDTFDSSWVYSTGRPIVETNGRGTKEEPSEDSKRNVGDSRENSLSRNLEETFLSRFPSANVSIPKRKESRTAKSDRESLEDKGEKVERQGYVVGEDESMKAQRKKKFEGVVVERKDSRIEERLERDGDGKETERKSTTETTISVEYFVESTPLTNREIIVTGELPEAEEEGKLEEQGPREAKDREISVYEKGINDAGESVSVYKFEVAESTTSTVSTTTSNDVRKKIEVKDDERKEKDGGTVERLGDAKDPRKEDSSSRANKTILPKSKRSKSVELKRIVEGRFDSKEKTRVTERNGGNRETKTNEDVDPISRNRGNVETSWDEGNSTETTRMDVSTSKERTLERTTTVVSTTTSSDRSISLADVEIEGITNSPLFDSSSTFSSDSFDTIAVTSIFGNVGPRESLDGSKTISWTEKTKIVDVSNRQSIGPTHKANITWPVKHSAVVEGDLVLGGLMMVHEREDTNTCGPVMPQGGVQALEAMLYTLDTLNQREIVPGVKIGAHILDDCDKDTYGLEMAVDFIKGSISNIDGAEYHCNKTTVRKVISGVVGAASSVTSIQVANLLRLFRIPQVSFFSTSPELSNKQRFEYFTRTIPSDHYQVKAMVDIVLKMGWSYVSIIYEESNYGIKAFEELEELLTKNDICIAVKEKLVKDSGVAEETAYDNIVLKLLTKPRAKGCIIFGSDQEVAGVMRAVRRCNATGAFSWIGSDGWSARGLVSNGNEAEVEGTLSVQPQANPVRGFEEYFLNLTVENNRRNPWFVEFWEDHFQCRYPNSSWTPYNKKYTKICSTKERLTKENTVFEDQLQFVSDAVMAFAYAFRDMHRDLCGGKAGLCEAMKPTKGTELLRYLRKVNFEGLSGDKFRFDKNGDGPARYNIIHFKQTEPGVYKWIRVGKYLEGVLHLNMSMVQFKLGHNQTPESVCSLPCEVGQAKKYVEGESCCWHCFNCSQYQIRHPDDETQCKNCRQGTVPDETHSTCREIPEEFLRLESGWAIGAMSFSSSGILVTLFVCGVFLKHNDTPVVRASGRELSYVLLSGILLCYLVTFALVLRPTDLVCSIQRFGAGFCFTVVYAALLTKTNRISRIFNAGKHSAKRPSFISPRSQLIICSGLVGVQILINGVWIVIDPAKAMHHYPTKEDNLLVCNSYIDASYMIAFAYPIMLIVVCTVYAILTRKIPEAFNESKYIGFTMYTTCVIWLAFVPLYFGTGNHVALRITSMSVTISLSASVTIACLFTPKLYIILIRPERNVRQNIMPPRPYNTTKSSAVTGTNASSMMAPVTLTAVTCDQNKAVKKHIITTMDCSTQSEYYELEVKELKNGKPPPSFVSRATQTQSNNNEKESKDGVHHVDKEPKDNARQANNTKIGNGPVSQNDVAL